MRITNERLWEKIGNIKEDTEEIKKENKEQWKVINKQGTDIAKMKGIGAVVALVFTAVCGYLGIKQ